MVCLQHMLKLYKKHRLQIKFICLCSPPWDSPAQTAQPVQPAQPAEPRPAQVPKTKFCLRKQMVFSSTASKNQVLLKKTNDFRLPKTNKTTFPRVWDQPSIFTNSWIFFWGGVSLVLLVSACCRLKYVHFARRIHRARADSV